MDFLGTQHCSNLDLHLQQKLLFIDGQDNEKKCIHIFSVRDDCLWRLRESHMRFPESINYVSLSIVPAFPTKSHFNYNHRELQKKNKEGIIFVLGFVLHHQFPHYSKTAAAQALAYKIPFICDIVL